MPQRKSPNSDLIEAAQPRYLQLARAIMQDIESGRYEVGSLLATEAEICQAYGLSRHTVREALRLLSERGLVSRQAGIGTRVMAKHSIKSHTRSISSISDLMQYAENSSQMILDVREVVAVDALCDLLNCKEGQRWYLIEMSRFVQGDTTPLSFSEIYINPIFSGAVPEKADKTVQPFRAPLFKIIEEKYGERPVEVQQKISAVSLPAKIANILQVKPRSPGLVLQRHYFGSNGRLMELAVNTYPADRFSYFTRLRLDSPEYE